MYWTVAQTCDAIFNGRIYDESNKTKEVKIYQAPTKST